MSIRKKPPRGGAGNGYLCHAADRTGTVGTISLRTHTGLEELLAMIPEGRRESEFAQIRHLFTEGLLIFGQAKMNVFIQQALRSARSRMLTNASTSLIRGLHRSRRNILISTHQRDFQNSSRDRDRTRSSRLRSVHGLSSDHRMPGQDRSWGIFRRAAISDDATCRRSPLFR